jgi:hypothetical protein
MQICKFAVETVKPRGYTFHVGKPVHFHIEPANIQTLNSLKREDPFSVIGLAYTPEGSEVYLQAKPDDKRRLIANFVPKMIGVYKVFFVCLDEVRFWRPVVVNLLGIFQSRKRPI